MEKYKIPRPPNLQWDIEHPLPYIVDYNGLFGVIYIPNLKNVLDILINKFRNTKNILIDLVYKLPKTLEFYKKHKDTPTKQMVNNIDYELKINRFKVSEISKVINPNIAQPYYYWKYSGNPQWEDELLDVNKIKIDMSMITNNHPDNIPRYLTRVELYKYITIYINDLQNIYVECINNRRVTQIETKIKLVAKNFTIHGKEFYNLPGVLNDVIVPYIINTKDIKMPKHLATVKQRRWYNFVQAHKEKDLNLSEEWKHLSTDIKAKYANKNYIYENIGEYSLYEDDVVIIVPLKKIYNLRSIK